MEHTKSYSPSYGWRSITSARSLVNRGLIKRVGTGDTISVWTDPWIPSQFPRPALSNGSPLDPTLQIQNLIDRQTNSWRVEVLQEHFSTADVAIINAIPIGNRPKEDTIGWHFTKNGKYTVKSGYHTARLPDPKVPSMSMCGPDFNPLLARVWKTRCPPKLQHFMWQVLTGCISVTANLQPRGINCDTTCARCGDQMETVNHVLFTCPPACQSWALAYIPVGAINFPTESVYANMDYMLRLTSSGDQDGFSPWLLWYIWKARNTKVFEGVDTNPAETVRIARDEARVWQEAQVEDFGIHVVPPRANPVFRGHRNLLNNLSTEYRCFVDGSWKDSDSLVGLGWFCQHAQEPSPMMGARNLRRSLSPLHAEVEALVWAMRCMIGHNVRNVEFVTDCSDLVKMVSSPTDWPAFSVYLDDITTDRKEFLSFSLSLVPRNLNVKADYLARQARSTPQLVKYVNHCPSHWLV